MRLQVVVFALVAGGAACLEAIGARSLRRPSRLKLGVGVAERKPPRLAKWYDGCLVRAPLRTKMASSGIVSAVGDAVAQLLTAGYDPRRSLVWALAGCFYFGPFLHYWYQNLAKAEDFARQRYGASKTTTVLAQFLMNQTVGAAFVNLVFCFVYSFLTMIVVDVAFAPASAFDRAVHSVQTTFVQIMLANWIIWPIPSFLNLWFVPLRYRVLFTNSVALVWKCVLSIITARSPSF